MFAVLFKIIGRCLNLFPANIGMLTGIFSGLLTNPKAVLRLLTNQSAYTKDTYKNYVRGVNELCTIMINGAKHAVLIRGCDKHNPVLLVLHGGPGATDIPFHSTYGQYLELDFVVVQYDQRSSCKSAVLNSSVPDFDKTITIQHHIDDAISMVCK